MPTSLGQWEFGLFVALVGAIFLIFFGVWRWLMPHPSGSAYHELVLPVATLIVPSIGWIFALVRQVPIPLLDGERVSSGIISLPFVFLLILAAVEFQRWFSHSRQEDWTVRIVTAGVLTIGLHDLWQNFSVWQIAMTAAAFAPRGFDPSAWFVASHPDLKYMASLAVGAVHSCISLGILLFLAWRALQGSARSARVPKPD